MRLESIVQVFGLAKTPHKQNCADTFAPFLNAIDLGFDEFDDVQDDWIEDYVVNLFALQNEVPILQNLILKPWKWNEEVHRRVVVEVALYKRLKVFQSSLPCFGFRLDHFIKLFFAKNSLDKIGKAVIKKGRTTKTAAANAGLLNSQRIQRSDAIRYEIDCTSSCIADYKIGTSL